MRIYNITHGSDIDGLASAALLVHYHKVPIKNVFFSQPGGKEFEDSLKLIKRIKGKDNLLVLTDIALNAVNNKKMVNAFSVFKKNGKGNRIIWLDHHPWDISSAKAVSKYCDLVVMGQLDVCAAELVYKILCKKDPFGNELAKIAHFADFAIYPKKYYRTIWDINYAQKVATGSESISNPKLRKLVMLIAKRKYRDKFITSIANAYRKKSKPYMDALAKSVKTYDIGKIRLAVGHSEKISNQDACLDMMERFNADIAVYIPIDSGHCSIRCWSRIDRKRMVRVGGVNGVALAKSLGGNGHPLASGFAVDVEGKKMPKSQIEALENRVVENARRIYG